MLYKEQRSKSLRSNVASKQRNVALQIACTR